MVFQVFGELGWCVGYPAHGGLEQNLQVEAGESVTPLADHFPDQLVVLLVDHFLVQIENLSVVLAVVVQDVRASVDQCVGYLVH